MTMKKLLAAAGGAVPVLLFAAYYGWTMYQDRQQSADDDTFDIGAQLEAQAEASRPRGSFHATGGELGEWQMNVNRCQSGERHSFSGVILYDEADNGRQVRIIETPQGEKQVVVQIPGEGVKTLEGCETIDYQVQQTGTVINFHDEIAGTVTLGCPNLEGTVTIPSCS